MVAVACCNFPTALLVLDDDEDFLENIQNVLSKQHTCICTKDVNKAKETLIKNRDWTKSLLKEGVSKGYSDENPAMFSVDMDISLLKKQVYEQNRFENIAVAIIDYDMPGKNGLAFVRSLRNSKIKIIMLTGKAQQSTIIQAFNKKEIHRYISKGDPDYLKILLQYVNELQEEFFLDFSKFILDSMKESKHKIFENKSYVDLFNKIIRENNIIEYYLLDESGSFLMLDIAGNQIWFIVKSEEDMKHFCELAQGDSDTPAYVLKNLKDRQSLTHFQTFKESTATAKHWNLVDAKPLDEKKQYFYALVKNDDRFQLDNSHIRSYQKFIKSKKDMI